ncbi:hypothetical protein GCM10009765_14000 [Fodinicola feengrottensis]|uniref:Uncharacterized protein n=1 Tax=Fodinicola feengrottensis TaxID=435914 RepID=A0ABN2G659_9ACTN
MDGLGDGAAAAGILTATKQRPANAAAAQRCGVGAIGSSRGLLRFPLIMSKRASRTGAAPPRHPAVSTGE